MLSIAGVEHSKTTKRSDSNQSGCNRREAGGDYGKIGETQSKQDTNCLVPASHQAGIQAGLSDLLFGGVGLFLFFKKRKKSGDFK